MTQQRIETGIPRLHFILNGGLPQANRHWLQGVLDLIRESVDRHNAAGLHPATHPPGGRP